MNDEKLLLFLQFLFWFLLNLNEKKSVIAGFISNGNWRLAIFIDHKSHVYEENTNYDYLVVAVVIVSSFFLFRLISLFFLAITSIDRVRPTHVITVIIHVL